MPVEGTVAGVRMVAGLLMASWALAAATVAQEPGGAPSPPTDLRAEDHPWDGGDQIDLRFGLSPDDEPPESPEAAIQYRIQRSGEYGGIYREVDTITADAKQRAEGEIKFTVGDSERGVPYFFRVSAIGPNGESSPPIETAEDAPGIARREWFDASRGWLAVITVVLCGSVVAYIWVARTGRELKVRKIAGLEAVDEAVGRATEMGRSCLFIPGIQDMNDIQTIAGLTILSRVAGTAAEYDARIEVPTSRSLVMTTARETVQSAFLAAGRPDAYNEDNIYYVTDEQFGYVAYLSGMMVREKPAACFYMGSFFAESLILAETGNAIGAIQVAGTAQPAQLPFFVAACDYTLIGEELFAASAYLSGEPDQLGSLKGQDVGKIIVAVLLLVGCGLLTVANLTDAQGPAWLAKYLTETVLK